eukprot:1961188-Heterocapsa_arctica.AAC.1
MTKRRERSPESDTGKGEQRNPRTRDKEANKYKKTEPGEASDISDNVSIEIKKAGELARQKDKKKAD